MVCSFVGSQIRDKISVPDFDDIRNSLKGFLFHESVSAIFFIEAVYPEMPDAIENSGY